MNEPTWSDEEARLALQTVMRRAAQDSAFRALCLSEPARAVREACGRDLPEGFRLHFVDNARADLTLVLPDPVASTLSDADLEAVAGGAEKQCAVTKHCGVSNQCNHVSKVDNCVVTKTEL